MGNFEGISRALEETFAELEAAKGMTRRRGLRKAHLLLLLADEMIAAAPAAQPSSEARDPFNDDVVNARALLPIFVEGAAHSGARGSCQGLQTVLVLRQRSDREQNLESARLSHARRVVS